VPIYTFKCEDCDHTEERVVKFSDAESQLCREMKTEVRGPGGITGWQPGDPDQQEYGKLCGGKMKRSEEIETAGRTSYAWKP
jgi:putative FmdB family regulatory protein